MKKKSKRSRRKEEKNRKEEEQALKNFQKIVFRHKKWRKKRKKMI